MPFVFTSLKIFTSDGVKGSNGAASKAAMSDRKVDVGGEVIMNWYFRSFCK